MDPASGLASAAGYPCSYPYWDLASAAGYYCYSYSAAAGASVPEPDYSAYFHPQDYAAVLPRRTGQLTGNPSSSSLRYPSYVGRLPAAEVSVAGLALLAPDSSWLRHNAPAHRLKLPARSWLFRRDYHEGAHGGRTE